MHQPTLTAECVATVRAFVPLMRLARKAGFQHAVHGVEDIEHAWDRGGRWCGVHASLFCGQLELRVNSPDPDERLLVSIAEGLTARRATALVEASGVLA